MRSIRKPGFTLIEVLVTIVVIGVLAAVVIPAVTAQVTAGDSARVVEDLNNVRSGVENFDIAVRQFPGDIDDLVNRPGLFVSVNASTTPGSVDADINGAAYASNDNWNGPYVEATLPQTVTSSTLPNDVGTAINTGYSGHISNKLLPCQITNTASACGSTSADYVVAVINNLTEAQQNTLNTLVDGANEATSTTSGKFRASSTSAYYFLAPFK
jgi:prepilin-type N-terminal cleavage/methylation domain-containing protein